MNYVSQVADRLVERSICISIVPPEIYTTIADWEKRGVPLNVAIASVDELTQSENAIDELRNLVVKNFRVWLQTKTT